MSREKFNFFKNLPVVKNFLSNLPNNKWEFENFLYYSKLEEFNENHLNQYIEYYNNNDEIKLNELWQEIHEYDKQYMNKLKDQRDKAKKELQDERNNARKEFRNYNFKYFKIKYLKIII